MRPRQNITDPIITSTSYCKLYLISKYDLDYIEAEHVAITATYLSDMIHGKFTYPDMAYFCDIGGRINELSKQYEGDL